MAPNTDLEVNRAVSYDFVEHDDEKPTKASPRKYKIYLPSIIYFIYCYVAGIYGMYLLFVEAKWTSVFCTFVFYMMTLLGLTAGAHRLFSHKSYKATKTLQVILMLFHSFAFQKSIFHWVRDHRLHHKYCDTDADPHNASRGFFYSHVGWLLVRKHPEVVKRKNVVYMKDVYSNSVVMFQHRNSRWFVPILAFLVPTMVAWNYGESLWTSWFINVFRIMVTTNITFFSNSLTHLWGIRPYDKNISACQNTFYVYFSMGEGFHNYHHVFPWDYRTGEISGNRINITTKFIDFCGRLGLAYDMKEVPEEIVKLRMRRTGDGTDSWGSKEYPYDK